MEPSVLVNGWAARQFSRIAGAGRTKPLILRCAPSDDGSAAATGEFVTKALGCPEITNEKLFAELFGTLLARELGVHIANPGVVHLGEEFVQVANGLSELRSARIQLSPGPAFGSSLVVGLHATAGLAPATDLEFQDAANIFAFDTIFQNPDRGATRLNVARDGAHLLAFDFECCFSFIYAVGSVPAPHEVSRVGGEQRHCLWKPLRGRPELLDPIVGRLGAITDTALDEMADLAPEHWQTHRTKILNHVKAARTELAALRTELRGLLS